LTQQNLKTTHKYLRRKIFENRRRDVISLNQPWSMLAKMAANGIQTHARTNQRHILA